MSGRVAELKIEGAIDLDWTRAFQMHAAELRSRDYVGVVRIWSEGRFSSSASRCS